MTGWALACRDRICGAKWVAFTEHRLPPQAPCPFCGTTKPKALSEQQHARVRYLREMKREQAHARLEELRGLAA